MPRRRIKVSFTLPEETIAFVDEMVEKRTFASRSHAIEVCVLEFKERRSDQSPKKS